MEIEVRRRDGTTFIREIRPKQNLVGLRITSIKFSSGEELQEVLRHPEWAVKHLCRSFYRVPQTPAPLDGPQQQESQQVQP